MLKYLRALNSKEQLAAAFAEALEMIPNVDW